MQDTHNPLETIYAIVHKTKKLAYVGRTSRTTEQRFAQHLADAANPFYEKRLSEELRHDRDSYDVIECERSDSASEAEWMARFRGDGYELLNTAEGNKKPPRRHKDAPEAWKERPIFVPTSLNGVGLKKISEVQRDEMLALPTAEERWAYVASL